MLGSFHYKKNNYHLVVITEVIYAIESSQSVLLCCVAVLYCFISICYRIEYRVVTVTKVNVWSICCLCVVYAGSMYCLCGV